MPITWKRTERKDITKLVCPDCRKKIKGVGLLKESKIDGLAIKCPKCGSPWELKTE